MPLHPTLTNLMEYVENLLTEKERARVKAHLEQPCPRCQETLARLEQMQQLLQQPKTTSQAPPEAVLQRMFSVFETGRPAWSQRVLAALQFDSLQQLSLAPVRGLPQARQMLFRAPGVDIDLRVTQDDGTASIHGQVLSSDEESEAGRQTVVTVSLQQAGEIVACTRTDEWGQFVFPYVPTGVYDLLVSYGEMQIAVENLLLEYGQ